MKVKKLDNWKKKVLYVGIIQKVQNKYEFGYDMLHMIMYLL